MSGQGRKIYHNGVLVADSIGADNIVTIEGNNVRIGAWSGSGNMDFEGSLMRSDSITVPLVTAMWPFFMVMEMEIWV